MILGSRKLVAVLAAAALAAGVGVGAATGAKRHAPGALLKAAAEYIGVSRADLVKEARAGQTLAQIAVAHGKTVDGLKAAMLSALKAKLDAAVASGKMTATQEQAKLARAERLIERIVNGRISAPKQRAGKSRLLKLAARYVGVTPRQLAAELKAGRSLAQVATAHGKTVDGLKAALLQPFKAKLDRAVASGRITAAQAQARLDKLSARLDRLINKTR
jgi:lambda repressor-like predicted transcriptional regulator